jgi:metal-responsive CopG/Arc/MetJ family transcriptional regulator
MNQKHISISLGEKLMTAFQENKILKAMNKSALVRDAVSDYIKRNLEGKTEGSENEKIQSENK